MPRRPQHRCTVCRRLHDGTGKCPSCAAVHQAQTDRARGSSSARGYGVAHRRAREAWAEAVAAGTVACARCGEQILPGEPWHLDHVDGDRSSYLGPSHAACNTAAGGRRRHVPKVASW